MSDENFAGPKFLCERWVRLSVCPLCEAIFCDVNQLGARGLSAVQNQESPLVGGRFTTSSIVNSIGAVASVRYREIVSWWEGPLWEVPLYIHLCDSIINVR